MTIWMRTDLIYSVDVMIAARMGCYCKWLDADTPRRSLPSGIFVVFLIEHYNTEYTEQRTGPAEGLLLSI